MSRTASLIVDAGREWPLHVSYSESFLSAATWISSVNRSSRGNAGNAKSGWSSRALHDIGENNRRARHPHDAAHAREVSSECAELEAACTRPDYAPRDRFIGTGRNASGTATSRFVSQPASRHRPWTRAPRLSNRQHRQC
jgi:hypothetical protein